jgi:hypothetical protein
MTNPFPRPLPDPESLEHAERLSCGTQTDLILRCLHRILREIPDPDPETRGLIRAIEWSLP